MPRLTAAPRLGLRDAEVDQVEPGVVAAGDPGVGTGAHIVRDAGPGVAAGLVGAGRGVEAPAALARCDVVAADEAALVGEAVAAAEALHDGAVHDDRAARIAEPVPPVGYRDVPQLRAVARVERHEAGVRRGKEQLLAVDGEVAAGAGVARRVDRHAVLPDQVAAASVDRLHHRTDARQVQDAVVRDWRRRVPAALGQRPHPRQLQLADVAAVDPVEGAVAPRLVIAADHQPVARILIAQHSVGDRPEIGDLALHRDAALAQLFRRLARGRGSRIHQRRGACGRLLGAGRGGYGDRGSGREPRAARRGAVGLQQIRHDVDVGRLAETVRLLGRHRAADAVVQVACRQIAPEVQEALPRQRRRLEAALQVRLVALRALALVHRAARIRLVGGVLAAGTLPGRHGRSEHNQRGERRQTAGSRVSPRELHHSRDPRSAR